MFQCLDLENLLLNARLPHTHKVKNTFTRKQKRMHTFDKDPPEEEIDVDL